MKLLIVESPNKIKKLKTFLDPSWVVAASIGHVCDLPEDDLGINLESGGFEQQYQINRGKNQAVANLKDLSTKAEEIYLASDPDREGEAIAWHLCRLLKIDVKSAKRASFFSITKEEVKKALEAPGTLDLNLVDAYKTRRAVDRIFGYQLSPEIRRFGMRSAGRCQTPCLHLVVQREEAIANFKPRKYFTLKAIYKEGFTSEYAEKDGNGKYKITKINKPEELELILSRLKDQMTHPVEDIHSYDDERKPKPPFITSTIITEAAAKLKFKPARTTEMLQSLFHKGVITYIRTDSTVISDEGLALAKQVLSAQYADIMAEKPVTYAAKKSAQGAHECIRPTHADDSNELSDSRDELLLYTLIRNRFLASQCKPQLFKRQDILLRAQNDIHFLARNRVETFPGFTRIYSEEEPDDKKEEEEGVSTTTLPLAVDMICAVDRYDTAAQETKPPPRFKLATLSKEIERQGFGRPSTFSSIVQIPLDRGYYEEDKKGFLRPTVTGTDCIQLLRKTMPEVIVPEFTRDLEEKLDVIAEAGNSYQDFMKTWFPAWTELLSKARNFFSTYAREIPAQDTRGLPVHKDSCPDCKSEMHVRSGKFGKYAECGSCRRKINLEFKVSKLSCPQCKEPMHELHGKFGKYYKCPKCAATLNDKAIKKQKEMAESAKAGILCPLCRAPMLERKYKDRKDGTEKKFYGCSTFPQCKGSRNSDPGK